jgi:nitrate reductase beta subunit
VAYDEERVYRMTEPDPVQRVDHTIEWIKAAPALPVYALINTYKAALPLHPEYRAMPMVGWVKLLMVEADSPIADL